MGSFFNPPSHLDFLKHKSPPPVWISKTKDPPPAWISGKIIIPLLGNFHIFFRNGLLQKKIHNPLNGWGRFLTPLSPGFPEAQDPCSCLDFQDKRPPSRLDFREKILGLNLFFFDIKYAKSCLEDVLFLISKLWLNYIKNSIEN